MMSSRDPSDAAHKIFTAFLSRQQTLNTIGTRHAALEEALYGADSHAALDPLREVYYNEKRRVERLEAEERSSIGIHELMEILNEAGVARGIGEVLVDALPRRNQAAAAATTDIMRKTLIAD